MDKFKLVSEYRPSGDQPEAITSLVNGVNWVCSSKENSF